MKKFRRIYVEITNICNLKCSFCPETNRKKKFMTLDRFEKIANEVAKYTDYIYLHIKGEPLMHPSLDEILDICYKNDLKVNIVTNGTLLKEKYKMLSNKNIRQINISLHSYEKNSNGPVNYDLLDMYLNDVIGACQYITNNSNILIRYKLWNKRNDDKQRYISDMNDYIISRLYKEYTIDKSWLDTINKDEFKDIVIGKNTYLSLDNEFRWPSLKNSENNIKKAKCYGLNTHIGILVDGSVVPCCLDNNGDITLGNVLNESLSSILDCKRSKDIINGFKNGICSEELCKKCSYINRFGR